MRLTKRQLKRIIREEYCKLNRQRLIKEMNNDVDPEELAELEANMSWSPDLREELFYDCQGFLDGDVSRFDAWMSNLEYEMEIDYNQYDLDWLQLMMWDELELPPSVNYI